MSSYQEPEKIRNISIIAHVDAGKTTLSEQILYHSGKTHKVGSIDEGTTTLDYLEEERKRGITIVSAAATVPWKDHFIHLIDTPGHIDFTAEVERALRVIDGTIVIFSAVEGVEAQSEKVWYQADKYSIPRIIFINKLDRLGANFSRVLSDINEKLGTAIPIQLPIGIEDNFQGIIDLIEMKFLQDGEATAEPIPQELQETAETAREEMLMTLADHSEAIAELYLSEQNIPNSLIKEELRVLTLSNSIIPVLCGSAKKDMGTESVLNAVLDYLPSPLDRSHSAITKNGKTIPINCNKDEHFTGFVFKLTVKNSHELLYLRTYSGHLRAGSTILNPRTNEKIKIKHLTRLFANNQENIEECGPGDIIALNGLKNTNTGDTLCSVNQPVSLDRITFPEPVISMALEPKKSGEKSKLLHTLDIITREDPTLFFKENEETGQYLISGMGELHLEITAHRIQSEFNLEIRQGEPKVAYKEMPNRTTANTFEFNRLTADKNLFGKVTINLMPTDRQDSEVVKIRPDILSHKGLVTEANCSLSNTVLTGGVHGFPLINCKVEITRIELNDQHAEESITPAIFHAFYEALKEAGTLIMEPVMNVETLSPAESAGEVINYLNSRKAEIKQIDHINSLEKVTAEVPLSKMFGFSKAIPKLTGGRGSFTMVQAGYQPSSD